MFSTKPNQVLALVIVSVALTYVSANTSAIAQEPPVKIPYGGPPPADPNALAIDGWHLYPSIDSFARYSDNYFLNPVSKISGWSFGVSPKITAEWSNGIHSTTLFGTFTHIQYPTNNEVNTNDGEATITQRYAPLRDLNFTFVGDYTHNTIAPGLTSAIPSPISSTATSVLPNGDTVLPNGNIVNPNGQVVGQLGPTLSVGGLSVVDPYDAYTATGKIQKIFGDGIVTLGTSLLRQNYELQSSQKKDYAQQTFMEDASFWLGPLFYIYSDGSFTKTQPTSPTPESDAYRVIGGLGTRQFGLFRTSAYFGHQGSQSVGSSAAGGNVYGGTLTYYPTPLWTINANVDVTINLAVSGAIPSTQALPVSSPLQIPLSSSTQISTLSISSEYKIAPDWTANALIGYSAAEFLNTTTWENALFGIARLQYSIRRDLSLGWEYDYTRISSNLPFTSTARNFVSMSASYKF